MFRLLFKIAVFSPKKFFEIFAQEILQSAILIWKNMSVMKEL